MVRLPQMVCVFKKELHVVTVKCFFFFFLIQENYLQKKKRKQNSKIKFDNFDFTYFFTNDRYVI